MASNHSYTGGTSWERSIIQIHEQIQKFALTNIHTYVTNIEIYYWGPCIQNLQVGHLALRILDFENEEDIYISHWPKGQKISFAFDMEDEGRGPDEYLLIPDSMINVENVKQWWKCFLKDASKGTENYNLLVNNCAQVVYRALRAGCFPHRFVLFNPLFTPFGVKEWIKCYPGVSFKKDYNARKKLTK